MSNMLPHVHRPADVPGQVSALCPFCKSANTEMISLFGMQLMTTQHYCNNCHSAFEAVKWEDRENPESQASKPQIPKQ